MNRADFFKALGLMAVAPEILSELGEEQFDFPMASGLEIPSTGGLLTRGRFDDLLRPGLKEEFFRAYGEPGRGKSFSSTNAHLFSR